MTLQLANCMELSSKSLILPFTKLQLFSCYNKVRTAYAFVYTFISSDNSSSSSSRLFSPLFIFWSSNNPTTVFQIYLPLLNHPSKCSISFRLKLADHAGWSLGGILIVTSPFLHTFLLFPAAPEASSLKSYRSSSQF